MSKPVPARGAEALFAAARQMAVAPQIVYSKPVALELPQPYTLPPGVAARRHTRILNCCVVSGRRKPE
ncbi:hypothetical protein QYH69_31500 [Paraburkholderia sp. SARCC-3016]|uniref:hypothetical protein n=1 Tax=Paraburkholderia sp. SARCC-3016 TaxID=3058611 RepID=UPI002809D64B|nr:hypothetical protein [Paraburkholderia sp. SARCC-3016]MDQ7981749.1 hypothetical protein [Paraburkholderia sp. SARCC-3016]